MTPWEKTGISRATYYRRRRAGKTTTMEAARWKKRHDVVAAELEIVKAELTAAQDAIKRLERLTRPHVTPKSSAMAIQALGWNGGVTASKKK